MQYSSPPARSILNSMVSDEKAKTRIGLFFPDEIVLDIVSRLPAKDAKRCRHVCRRWWYLTTTREFFDLHLQRQGIVPLILAENGNNNWRFDHFLMDKWWEPTPTTSRSRVQNFPICTDYLVQFSHYGLVVLKQTPSAENYLILNPINGENVKISLSREMSGSEIYGVFYHPSLKEYCTLWLTMLPEQLTSPGNQARLQYKLLNLGPNPCWRDIKSTLGHQPRICTMPVLVDKYLYWMVEAENYDGQWKNSRYNIMEFDVNSEELTLMRPPKECCNKYESKLMNIDGVLSMVVISQPSELLLVRIWTLRIRSEQLWTDSEYRINNDIYKPMPRTINPIAVVDAELAFFSEEKIFVCNLKAGTIRNFGEKLNSFANVFPHVMTLASLRECKSILKVGTKEKLNSFAKVFPHVMTLASLRECKSEFCMGDKGEEDWAQDAQ